jgi:starch phosphorylase
MVRDYTLGYYVPAAVAGHAMAADGYFAAKALAEFRRRVESAWPSVRVLQVDGSGLPDTPEIGSELSLRAKVDLAGLGADDVLVEAVLGRVGASDELTDVVAFEMTTVGPGEYGATIEVPVSGAVGYTVRVLPRNELMARPAEFGLVTLA